MRVKAQKGLNMKKSFRIIKTLCAVAVIGSLLAFNSLPTFASPTDTALTLTEFTFPYHDEGGLISYGCTEWVDADSEAYLTPESTFKINATSADALPGRDGFEPTFYLVFYPYVTASKLGLSKEEIYYPAQAYENYNESPDEYHVSEGVLFQEAPYSFNQSIKFVTPELIDFITQYGVGTLMCGVSDKDPWFTLSSSQLLIWQDVTLDYFILDGSTAAAPAEPSLPEQQPVVLEQEAPAVVPAAPVAPAQGDVSYTVGKDATLACIALNYYGSSAYSSKLYQYNKEIMKQNQDKLVEGMTIQLPAAIGKQARIEAPVVNAGETLYVVKEGDNLKKIAKAIYGSQDYYELIFNRNTDRLKNASTIYSGRIIVLPVNS